MASKTFAELAVQTDVQDGDLFATYRGSGPLKQLNANLLAPYVTTGLSGTSGHKFGFLDGANTWSALQTVTLGTAVTALDYIALKPSDYGTGKPGFFISKLVGATGWQIQLFDGTDNTGSLALKVGTFALTGALTVSGTLTTGAITVSGGVTQTGSTKQGVTAVAALSIDLSLNDYFTKAISSNSTFTFDNPTASTGQGFVLQLTITSAAVPTWPASVQWAAGVIPTLGNGRHVLGFLTFNGGTVWTGFVGALNAS